MTTYKLGKITNVRVGYQAFQPILQVWFDLESKNSFDSTLKFLCTDTFLKKLTFDAKVSFLDELKNMPVKVKFRKDHTTVSFRILTEVL